MIPLLFSLHSVAKCKITKKSSCAWQFLKITRFQMTFFFIKKKYGTEESKKANFYYDFATELFAIVSGTVGE